MRTLPELRHSLRVLPSYRAVTRRPPRRLLRVRAYTPLDRLDSELDRMFAEAERAQREDFQRLFEDSRSFNRRSETVIVPKGSDVRVQKSEQRSGNSYQYYESVVITSGTGFRTLQPAQMANSPFSSLMTFMVLFCAAVYAFFTYRFNRNYERSTFKKEKRTELSLLWPVLLTSPEFREKFQKVVYPSNKNVPTKE